MKSKNISILNLLSEFPDLIEICNQMQNSSCMFQNQ